MYVNIYRYVVFIMDDTYYKCIFNDNKNTSNHWAINFELATVPSILLRLPCLKREPWDSFNLQCIEN